MGAPITSYPLLQQILPSAYKYNISGFAELNETGQNYLNKCQFKTSFQLNLRNKLEVKLWIKDFEKTCGVKWQISKTYLGWGSRGNVNVYQVDLKCHHTTLNCTAVKKNASNSPCCPAKMSVMVKEGTQVLPDELCHLPDFILCTDELVSPNPWEHNDTESSPRLGGLPNTLDGQVPQEGRTQIASSSPASRCEDLCSKEFPTTVYLSFQHNHQLFLPDPCEKEDVSKKITQKLIELYRSGYTPLTALEAIKSDLQKDYYFMAGDRSQFPDKQFCYRVYYSMFSPSSLPSQPSSNDTSVDLHNKQCDEEMNKSIHVNHNTKLGSPLNTKLHVNHNKQLLERQLHGHSRTFLSKRDLDHCKVLDKPVSSVKLGEEIEVSYTKTLNEDILVDIHNKPSSEKHVSDNDERLNPYCKTYQIQCTDVKLSDENFLSDLQDNLKQICGMYNLKCAKIEKCDDQVIVAVCSPVAKLVSSEYSDTEECEYDSSVPEDKPYLECESVPAYFQSEKHTNESAIEHCIEDMRTVFDDLLTKVEYNPEAFVKPMAIFFQNYHRIKEDNDLKSALHTFGKYTNLIMPIFKSLKSLHVIDSFEGEQSNAVCARKRKGTHLHMNSSQLTEHENCHKKKS